MLSLKNESKINALCFVPKNKQFNLGIKSQQWHSQPDLLNGLMVGLKDTIVDNWQKTLFDNKIKGDLPGIHFNVKTANYNERSNRLILSAYAKDNTDYIDCDIIALDFDRDAFKKCQVRVSFINFPTKFFESLHSKKSLSQNMAGMAAQIDALMLSLKTAGWKFNLTNDILQPLNGFQVKVQCPHLFDHLLLAANSNDCQLLQGSGHSVILNHHDGKTICRIAEVFKDRLPNAMSFSTTLPGKVTDQFKVYDFLALPIVKDWLQRLEKDKSFKS